MRRLHLASAILGSLALASCSSSDAPALDGPVAAAESAIAYGSPDTTHTAVVALLGNAGNSSFDECSGTIVQVKNGSAYVLTAAHCCNDVVPTVVVMSSDYGVGEQYIFGGTPQPPAYAVTASSVWYDSAYNMQDHDFCMLKFAAPANTPSIPVAQPGQDGVSLGVQVEHVGFGVTDTTTNNTGRRHATEAVDQSVTALILQSSQGGSSHIPGVCEGDSGGPALLPAGAAQSSQKVVATTSYGNSTSCAQNTMNVCSRVTSETGPGGFITNYLNDTPSGTQAGSAQASCSACAQSSEQSQCKAQAQACANDSSCLTLDQCLGSCSTQACVTSCETTAGTTAVNELNAFDDCVCNTACPTQCASECGSSSSSSSSSGGMNCGLMSNDATCNTCLDGSCCTQAAACAKDTACVMCLGTQTPPASCSSNANLNALSSCLGANCASACGGSMSTSSSSSSSASGGTTTSSASTSSSASSGGVGGASPSGGAGGASPSGGAGGGTGAGTVSNGAGGQGSVQTSSGCQVSETGDAGSSTTSIAGLLLGAALAFSQRRRERGRR